LAAQLEEVVNCIEQVTNIRLSSKKGAEILKGFRTRARSIPTTLFTRGLAYTTILISSRSSSRLVELGLLKNSCEEIASEVARQSEEYDVEKLSYGLYGAVILFLLRKGGVITSTKLSDMLREVVRDSSIDSKATTVFEWIKRLAEAYIAEK